MSVENPNKTEKITLNITTIDSFLIIVLICFIIFSGFHFNLYDSKTECISRWSGSNQTVKYSKVSGCMVKINNAWIKEDNIIVSLPSKMIKG